MKLILLQMKHIWEHAAALAIREWRMGHGPNSHSTQAFASCANNTLNVHPRPSFHSMGPFALRPSTTAAAIEGEVNPYSCETQKSDGVAIGDEDAGGEKGGSLPSGPIVA